MGVTTTDDLIHLAKGTLHQNCIRVEPLIHKVHMHRTENSVDYTGPGMSSPQWTIKYQSPPPPNRL